MRRLDAFPGFVLPSRGGSLGIKKVVREVANILEVADDPAGVVESPRAPPAPPAQAPPPAPVNPFASLVVKPRVVPTALPPTAAPMSMIQPRDSDGQRLLYKHPNLPAV